MSSYFNQLMHDNVLAAVVDELCNAQDCHTVILYGSRAKGTHTASSDYDILAVIFRISPTWNRPDVALGMNAVIDRKVEQRP